MKLKPVFLFELSNSISLLELPEALESRILLLSEFVVNQIPLPLLSLKVLLVILQPLLPIVLSPPSFSSTVLELSCVKFA